MAVEPQKFFIGVIDLFSILLPGAVLTYLFQDQAGTLILGEKYSRLQGTEGWVVFLFSSYLLGHFLFFIGSWMDDYVYDPTRKATDKEQIFRLLTGRSLSPWFVRGLANFCFKKQPNAAVDRVVEIKEDYLKRIKSPKSVNAFQWSKAMLTGAHPEAIAAVNRFEADSKFFRSFIPVMIVLLIKAGIACRIWLALAATTAMVLAFLRYMEQRFKTTQQAYWHILTLEAAKASSPTNLDSPSPSNTTQSPKPPTHAGGVVFRKSGGNTKYLLVQAKNDAKDWVLPKGHIEAGESMERCAIREVKEETGVWARIKREITDSKYTVKDEVVVRFFLMEQVGKGEQNDELRETKWVTLNDAINQWSVHAEIRGALELAEKNIPT